MFNPLVVATDLICSIGGLSALFVAGFLLAKICFSDVDLSRRLSAVPVLGFGAASVWLSLGGRFLSWNIAVYTWLAFGFMGLWWCWRFHKPCLVFLYTERRKVAGVMGVFILFLTLALLGGLYDEGGHFPFAGLIANGNWPARFPFDASLPFVYHLGFDIVIAAFGKLGLWIPLASDFFVALLETSLVCLVYLFTEQVGLTGSKRLGLVILWFCAGSFGWILRPLRAILPPTLAIMPPFTSTIGNAIGLLVYTKSQLFAFGFFLCLLVFRHEWRKLTWRKTVVLGLGTAAMAFSSDTFFVMLVPFVYLAYFLEMDRRSRIYLYLAGLLCALVVVLQGGIISDAITNLIGHSERTQSDLTSFVLRSTSRFHIFGYPLDLRSGWTWVRFIFEWGMQIVLFILTFITWRRWDRWDRCIFVGVGLAFLFPFLIVYPVGQHDILRMWGNAFFVSNLFGALVLARYIQRQWVWTAVVVLGSLGGFFSIILSNVPIVSWMAPTRPQIGSTAFWQPFLEQTDRLPRDSRIWISVDGEMMKDSTSFLVRQVPLVFGSYVKTCEDMYQRVFSTACETFYITPNAAGLDDLQATHLLLSTTWEERHRADPWFSRLTFVKRFEPAVWTRSFSSWWDLDHSTYTLYVVR